MQALTVQMFCASKREELQRLCYLVSFLKIITPQQHFSSTVLIGSSKILAITAWSALTAKFAIRIFISPKKPKVRSHIISISFSKQKLYSVRDTIRTNKIGNETGMWSMNGRTLDDGDQKIYSCWPAWPASIFLQRGGFKWLVCEYKVASVLNPDKSGYVRGLKWQQ